MPTRLASQAMGTRFELVLSDGGGGLAPDKGSLALVGEDALREIEECDERLSLFRKHSFLSYLNREASRGPVRVDEDTFELLESCLAVHAASGGAFDPTIAPRMRALGLQVRPPDPTEVIAGCGAVVLDRDARTVRFTRPAALDLGGVGKGHALDLATRVLREHGVASALLHGGTSTVVALGAPPGKDGWGIQVEPPPGTDLRPAVVELRDDVLAVSAPHGRELSPGGASHLLDPRTGEPAKGARLAAIVLPLDEPAPGSRADAWSTALCVGGEVPDGVPDAADVLLARADGEWIVAGRDPGRFRWHNSRP